MCLRADIRERSEFFWLEARCNAFIPYLQVVTTPLGFVSSHLRE
jgi:hypothetical protein